jgi:S-adenosylmethionine hydrolase
VHLPSPRLHTSGGRSLEGEILYADRFGNYLTSLGVFLLQPENRLLFHPWLSGVDSGVFDFHQTRLILPDGAGLPLVETFGQIPPGEVAVLVGSSGLLEIAANRLSAAEMLRLEAGTLIRLIG